MSWTITPDKKAEGDEGEIIQPNAIPEAVKVLTVFVKARKNKTFAYQMGDIITENIFTLSFDDPGFNFKTIYEKLLTYLRHREISAQGSSVQSPAVFTTKVFSAMVRQEFKKFAETTEKGPEKGLMIAVVAIFEIQKGQSQQLKGYIQLQCGTAPSVGGIRTTPRSFVHSFIRVSPRKSKLMKC